jgi:hypothetical protein
MAAFARACLCVQGGVLSGVWHLDLRIWHDVGDWLRRGRNCTGSRNLPRFIAPGSYRVWRLCGVHFARPA